MALSDLIKKIRVKGNYTQEQLAKELCISRGAIAGYEIGRRPSPAIYVAFRIVELSEQLGLYYTLEDIYKKDK